MTNVTEDGTITVSFKETIASLPSPQLLGWRDYRRLEKSLSYRRTRPCFTAEAGFEIDDVLVDGVSVGR